MGEGYPRNIFSINLDAISHLMLVNRYKTVYLSFIATDLPVWNIIEATASLYQKERDRFHLLLSQQNLPFSPSNKRILDSNSNPCLHYPSQLNNAQGMTKKSSEANSNHQTKPHQGLFWLELSPYRVIMTMQGNNSLSYRHFWEQGVYGVSRYCLNANPPEQSKSLRLRNFTRYLNLEGSPFPKKLQIEYELWSDKIQLGAYVLHLDIDR